MNRSAIKWMLIQLVVVCCGVWLEFDMARQFKREPSVTTGLIVGVIAAFAVTALWIDARPRLIAFIRRYLPSRRNAGPTFDPGTAIAHDSEASGESERLAAPARSGSDGPKLIRGRRIS